MIQNIKIKPQFLAAFVIVGLAILVIATVYAGWIMLVIALIPILGVIAFTLFVSKPEWGLVLLFIETILGGNGHWVEFLNGAVTPRYFLIVAVVLGYVVRVIAFRRNKFRRSPIWLPLSIFGITIVIGILLAVLNKNPEPFSEPQVWLYLIVYPLVVDLWKTIGFPNRLLRVMLWCVTGMAAFTLLLMLAGNLAPQAFFEIYERTPLELMRITAPVLQGASLIYIFWGNSLLAGLALAVSILLLNTNARRSSLLSTSQLRWIAVLSLLTMVFSMTRGTWGQLAITLALIGVDLLVRRQIPIKILILFAILGTVLVGTILSVDFVREAFVTRFETLLPENRDNLADSDSIVIKAREAEQQLNAIAARPIVGYGFGIGDYASYGDRMDGSRFHNWFLEFTLKTGWLGLASLFFLLGTMFYQAFRVGYAVRRTFPEYRAVLFGWVYGLIGIMSASTSNPHMGTPAFVIALGLGMALIDLVRRQASIATELEESVGGGKNETEYLHR